MSEREKLLDKVRALLNKTREQGCTEYEELAALAKARAMIDAYEISEDELKLAKEEGAAIYDEPPGTHDPHSIKFFLSGAVAKFCECDVWRNRDKTLTFCGAQSDIQWATWLLDHLTYFVQEELANHLMTDISEGRDRKTVIYSFIRGCTGRISARLNELVEQSKVQMVSTNSRELVVVKKHAIEAKIAELGLKFRRSSSNRNMDPGAHRAGRAAGDRASFGRPVTSGGASRLGRK
jgi:hypothetical protein